MSEKPEDRSAAAENGRESPLTIARELLPWCIALIFAMTIGWTALIIWDEVSNGNHLGLAETVIAVGVKASPAAPFIVLLSVTIVSVTDLLGGFAVVTARVLTRKFVKPLIERQKAEAERQRAEAERQRAESRAEGLAEGLAEGIAEGIAEGRAEGIAEGVEEGRTEERRLWASWNRRRMNAEARGDDFDEPPPEL